jgi:hypothetical protein
LFSTGLANQGGEADEAVERFQAKNRVIYPDLETRVVKKLVAARVLLNKADSSF